MRSILPESAPDDRPTRGFDRGLTLGKSWLAQIGRAMHADIIVGNA
jgi:hypothetical protein